MPDVTSDQVTVDTTADGTLLAAGDVHGAAFSLCNRGDGSVFVGAEGVTSSDGYELEAGDTLGGRIRSGAELWAIAAAGSERVDVLLTGLD